MISFLFYMYMFEEKRFFFVSKQTIYRRVLYGKVVKIWVVAPPIKISPLMEQDSLQLSHVWWELVNSSIVDIFTKLIKGYVALLYKCNCFVSEPGHRCFRVIYNNDVTSTDIIVLFQNCGTGVLRVIYDDDVNANKVTFTTDKKEDLCNHLIAMESNIIL